MLAEARARLQGWWSAHARKASAKPEPEPLDLSDLQFSDEYRRSRYESEAHFECLEPAEADALLDEPGALDLRKAAARLRVD